MSEISKGERSELCALIRRREKLEKALAAERRAELLADFEQQLGSIHAYDTHETWARAYEFAREAIAKANVEIANHCATLGIPTQFSPKLAFGWMDRGENASKGRREELRRMAVTRLDALEKQAKSQIERRATEMQEQVIVAGLTSDAAKNFIEQMPAVSALMPRLDARSLLQVTNDAAGGGSARD